MIIWKKAYQPEKKLWSKLPPTCAIAKKYGSRYYFTGKPDKSGVIGIRYTSSGATVKISKRLMKLPDYLYEEWHPTKNKTHPDNKTCGSTGKAWWICPKGHEYEAYITHRARTSVNKDEPTGCPICAGYGLAPDTTLASKYPDVAKEWHPTKNNNDSPSNIYFRGKKKYWWMCVKGHEWQAKVESRTILKRKCPICQKAGTSLPEMRIYFELKSVFHEVIHRYRYEGRELDVFLPRINIGIEYDGYRWHEKKLQQDKQKNIFFLSHGITIIRIREKGLSRISNIDLVNIINLNKKTINKILKVISENCETINKDYFNKYLIKNNFVNNSEYKNYISNFPKPILENSLSHKFPMLSKEWHPVKNNTLSPYHFTPKSGEKVWWLCKNNRNHEWEAVIASRTANKNGCPYCSHRFASTDYNLEIDNPNLAKEWHPLKNGNNKPYQFTPRASNKVWWICKYGHEWTATISKRNAHKNPTGCPICNKGPTAKKWLRLQPKKDN